LSLADQCIHIPKAGFVASLMAGETIHTESCHKFDQAQIESMAHRGGWRVEAQWLDGEWGFAETLLIAAYRSAPGSSSSCVDEAGPSVFQSRSAQTTFFAGVTSINCTV